MLEPIRERKIHRFSTVESGVEATMICRGERDDEVAWLLDGSIYRYTLLNQ